jgi:beta-lactam-binding protein with PASTA domain
MGGAAVDRDPGWVARLFVGALTLLFTLPLASAGASAQTPTPAVSVAPDTGPPGTMVSVVARGYADCPTPVTDDVSSYVRFLWDGTDEVAETVVAADGTATASFLVPDTTGFGEHDVVATCTEDDDLTSSTTFAVTPPEEVRVVVPSVIGLEVDEASARLRAADLEPGPIRGTGGVVASQDPAAGTEVVAGTPVALTLEAAEPEPTVVPDLVDGTLADAREALGAASLVLGGVSGDGEVVRRQSPRAGAEVPVGTTVDVTVGPLPPETAVVPDLRGRALDDVPPLLEEPGLVLGVVTGAGDVVRDQDPVPGSEVPRGSAVNVSVDAQDPVVVVPVPDLSGATAEEARGALDDLGLELAGELDEDGTVATQDPAPGTLVPIGSAVTVSAHPPPPDTAWWAVVVGLAATLLAALRAARSLRPWRDRRWVRRHLRARSRGLAGIGVEVVEASPPGSPPTHVVRLAARHEPETIVLEEV